MSDDIDLLNRIKNKRGYRGIQQGDTGTPTNKKLPKKGIQGHPPIKKLPKRPR